MKATMISLLVVSIVFAGCTNPTGPPHVADDPQGSVATDPSGSMDASAPLNVTFGLMGDAVTRNESIDYFVESDGPLSVTLRFNGTTFASEIVDGRQEWTLPLPFGHRDLNVTLDAPGISLSENVTLVREARTTLKIDWCYLHPDYPGQRRTYDGEYLVDVDTRPSTPLYAAAGGTHRDFFTAHDQLYLFEERTGMPVDASYSAQFNGFLINKIDDVGNPPFWNFEHNGVLMNVGVSEVALADGDAVTFFLVDSAEAPLCT